jgi:hypothetical protein
VRDYIDVHGVLADGRFTGDELLRMAADHDPGFDAAMFAEALRAVQRLPASAFEPYKLTSDEVEALTVRLLGWAEEIESAMQQSYVDPRSTIALARATSSLPVGVLGRRSTTTIRRGTL